MAGIKMGVVGCGGRMGRMLVAEIAHTDGCSVAGGSEAPGLVGRVAVEQRRLRHVALAQPHAGAVLEVDGGVKDHAALRSFQKNNPATHCPSTLA